MEYKVYKDYIEDWSEDRPVLRLPVPAPAPSDKEEEKTESRYVIIIDMVDPE